MSLKKCVFFCSSKPVKLLEIPGFEIRPVVEAKHQQLRISDVCEWSVAVITMSTPCRHKPHECVWRGTCRTATWSLPFGSNGTRPNCSSVQVIESPSQTHAGRSFVLYSDGANDNRAKCVQPTPQSCSSGPGFVSVSVILCPAQHCPADRMCVESHFGCIKARECVCSKSTKARMARRANGRRLALPSNASNACA